MIRRHEDNSQGVGDPDMRSHATQANSRGWAECLRRLTVLVAFWAVSLGAVTVFAQGPGPAGKNGDMTEAEAIRLGEEFGLVVGEVDEEIRKLLGMQRAEGVVVFEVIGGTPADLAGIKVRAVIKEIDKVEVKTLLDFGRALKRAMPTQNFTVGTYEPADPDNQGVGGLINFHFVRIIKD